MATFTAATIRDADGTERGHVVAHCKRCRISLDVKAPCETCRSVLKVWTKWHANCEVAK